jgi:hypothetical protein
MRSLLLSLMLIIMAVYIYELTIGGKDGALTLMQSSSESVSNGIEQINP